MIAKKQLGLVCIACLFALVAEARIISHTKPISNPPTVQNVFDNAPPVLVATGNQVYCPGSPMNIVTNMSITDPDDTTVDAVYIQISSGYNSTQDQLSLTGNHPGIVATWDVFAGKLTLKSPIGIPVAYTAFVAAIKDVVYNNSSPTPSGSRNFSITVGQANYLPSTGHYYQFVPSLGITWSDAKIAAQNSTYYGLQGYLATIGAADEAQLSGEQSSGAGWIGGSDAENEGVWKWVTGPENGTIFWNGGPNGATPNFAFWNSGEPNNSGSGENYAHVTAPGVGITGSWNDLSNTGEASGDYQPKGYIVEYGGMPGDPVLNISASTTISIPSITGTTAASNCGPGILTLSATVDNGTAKWYDSAAGGTLLFSGNTFTTPLLSSTQTYYASAFGPDCTTSGRIAVVAAIFDIPVLTVTPPAPSCEGSFTITASTNTGTIQWFSEAEGGTALFSGTEFTTPTLTESTTYYVGVTSLNCPNGNRQAVTAVVYPKPVVTDEDNVGICGNGSAVLDAGVLGVSYLWTPGGQTTKEITVGAPGTYTVTVTTPAPQNCSATKTFTVIQKKSPVITGAVVIANVLTIYTSNSGDFEYSLDGVHFQDSPVFLVNGAPIDMVYAREVHGCGEDDQPFSAVIDIPAYFSPNGDGYADLWTVHSIVFYPEAKVDIYDRYGKFLAELSKTNLSWDGMYNRKPLPSDDYWFVLSLNNAQPEIRGHFSLKR
jgi:gliding motility-associated-like protein